MSLGQGGPPPRFLQEWCYQYLVTGTLKNITKENVHDAELSPLIQKVWWNLKCSSFIMKVLFGRYFFWKSCLENMLSDWRCNWPDTVHRGNHQLWIYRPHHLGSQRQHSEVYTVYWYIGFCIAQQMYHWFLPRCTGPAVVYIWQVKVCEDTFNYSTIVFLFFLSLEYLTVKHWDKSSKAFKESAVR